MAQSNDDNNDLMMEVLFKISNAINEFKTESPSTNEVTSRGPQDQYKKMLVRQNIMKKLETDGLNKKIKFMTDSIRRKDFRRTVLTIIDIINEIATDSQKSYIINNIRYSYDTRSPMSSSSSSEMSGLVARSNVPNPGIRSSNLDFDQFESIPEPSENSIEIQPDSLNYDCGLKQPITKYNMSEHYLISNGIGTCRDKLAKDLKTVHENKENSTKTIIEIESKKVLPYVVNEEVGGEKSLVEALADKYPDSSQELIELIKVNKDAILGSQIFFQLAKKDPNQLKHLIYILETKKLADKMEIRRAMAENRFNGETVSEILAKDRKTEENVIEVIQDYISKYKAH